MKLSLALIAVTASSSSARINEARRLQSDPIACPAIENPVCGIDGNTYANDCVANATGVEVAYTGQCYCDLVDEECYPYTGGKPACCTVSNAICGVDKPPCQTGASYCYDMPDFSCYTDGHPQCCLDENGKVSPTAAETCAGERNCDVTTTTSTPGAVCTMQWDPVCGEDANGVRITYGNSCMAEAAGAKVVSEGECPVPCPLNIDIVCGANGVNYDNECLAEAGGTTVASKGECPCPKNIDFVCGANGFTYDNECLAIAAGTTVASQGACPEPVPCPLNIDPVCGEHKDGTKATYDNECLAEAAGATVVSQGDCNSAVVCTMQWDPVCGEDANGVRITYGNSCMAEAAGAKIVSKGECPAPLITTMNVTDTSMDGTPASTATPSTDTGAVGVKNDPAQSSASAAVFNAANMFAASVFIYALV